MNVSEAVVPPGAKSRYRCRIAHRWRWRARRLTMQHSMRWAVSLCLVAALAACGSEDEEEAGAELPEVDCSGDVPTFDEVTAFSAVCTDCHSTSLSGDDRNGAPARVNWDDYESARANAEDGAEAVFDGEMPPAGAGELTSVQKEELYRWALCGTPE
jgi:uncharacterized membrane protein